jgi:hypothetical protein
MSLTFARLTDLIHRHDSRGDIFVGEIESNFPFEPHRFFFIKDVPSSLERGGHCLKTCEQALISVVGSVDITLKTPNSEETVSLASPKDCLYVPPQSWREMSNFSSDAVLLVLASTVYDELDYIRDWDTYLSFCQSEKPL